VSTTPRTVARGLSVNSTSDPSGWTSVSSQLGVLAPDFRAYWLTLLRPDGWWLRRRYSSATFFAAL